MFDSIPALHAIPALRHVISNRLGGVSTGAFASLNLGYHVGDEGERVTENRRRFARAVGYDPSALIAAQQVHGTAVARVGLADRGRGACAWESAIPDTDGLLVRDPGVPVMIQVADCAPVLIVDPARHQLAVVHAGWRGALGGIAAAVVRMMLQEGTAPADLLVGIGPALCPSCLEVGEEVAAAARATFGPAALPPSTARPHLDLAAVIAMDLARVGVAEERIYRHPDCTRCCPGRFFSHRGQQGQAGRFALVAWWEE